MRRLVFKLALLVALAFAVSLASLAFTRAVQTVAPAGTTITVRVPIAGSSELGTRKNFAQPVNPLRGTH